MPAIEAESVEHMTPVLVNVEELYHQFGGGVFKSPLGIRRFCNLAINTWPTYPSHLFLIGKSIRDVTEGNSIGSRKVE